MLDMKIELKLIPNSWYSQPIAIIRVTCLVYFRIFLIMILIFYDFRILVKFVFMFVYMFVYVCRPMYVYMFYDVYILYVRLLRGVINDI